MLGAAIEVVDGDAERALWSQHNERVWDGPGAIVRASWLPANVAAVIGELKSCAATSGVIEIEMLGRAAVGAGLIRIDGDARRRRRASSSCARSAVFGNVVMRARLDGAEGARRRLGTARRAPAAVRVAEARVRSARRPQRRAEDRYERVRTRRFDAIHPPDRAR